LIDADPLREQLKKRIEETENMLMCRSLETFMRLLDLTPTADAEPVVRCKDCFLYGECQAAKFYGDDGFCSVGERSER
jgi:hypothetical protein